MSDARRASSDGEVGFAGSYPGRIQAFDLTAGQSVLVQRDSFLFAQTSVQLNIALVKKLGAGFFGGVEQPLGLLRSHPFRSRNAA